MDSRTFERAFLSSELPVIGSLGAVKTRLTPRESAFGWPIPRREPRCDRRGAITSPRRVGRALDAHVLR